MSQKSKFINLDKLKESAIEVSELLKLLADPSRLLILCYLNDEEKNVGDLEKDLKISQSSVSQKLSKLKDKGLICSRREGKKIFYKIKDPKVLILIKTLYDTYCTNRG